MTTKLPLVTIITPSYNQGKFIEQTIQSVLNQTYPSIEYFVMDGGSTDETISIIKKYDSRISYWVSEIDNGQTDAINKGLERANGEIICYLNSDDLLEENAVEVAVKAFLQNTTLALVYGKCATINEHGIEVKAAQGGEISYKKQLMIGMLPWVFQPACFFNSKVINRKPLFKANLHYTMDYELVLYILKAKLPFQFIEKPFAKYRIHSNAKTSSSAHELYLEKLSIQFEYAPLYCWLWAYKYGKHQLKRLIYPTGQ